MLAEIGFFIFAGAFLAGMLGFMITWTVMADLNDGASRRRRLSAPTRAAREAIWSRVGVVTFIAGGAGLIGMLVFAGLTGRLPEMLETYPL